VVVQVLRQLLDDFGVARRRETKRRKTPIDRTAKVRHSRRP
jgi:hypothetical protein